MPELRGSLAFKSAGAVKCRANISRQALESDTSGCWAICHVFRCITLLPSGFFPRVHPGLRRIAMFNIRRNMLRYCTLRPKATEDEVIRGVDLKRSRREEINDEIIERPFRILCAIF